MKTNKLVVPIACVLVVIAAGSYVFARHRSVQVLSPTTTATSTVVAPPDWKVCKYPGFGFEFPYPPDWKVFVISNSQGGGERGPDMINCGDVETWQILGQLSLRPSPETTSTQDVGMQIEISQQVAATLDEDLSKQRSLTLNDPIVGRSTLAGAESVVLQSGSVISLNDKQVYKISFGGNTSAATRTTIMQTFKFLR
jgi:hypothetical protein